MKEEIDLELMKLIRLTENVIKRSKAFDQETGSGYGRIMGAVYHNSGMTQSQLADTLEIRPQSLTRALSQLEEKGLIYRKRLEGDRRNIGVYISQEGMKHHDRITEGRKRRANIVFECLNEEEKEMLSDLLGKVVDTYNRKEKEEKR